MFIIWHSTWHTVSLGQVTKSSSPFISAQHYFNYPRANFVAKNSGIMLLLFPIFVFESAFEKSAMTFQSNLELFSNEPFKNIQVIYFGFLGSLPFVSDPARLPSSALILTGFQIHDRYHLDLYMGRP